MLNLVVHPADVQDRDDSLLVLQAVRKLFPFIERIFADGGYQGPATAAAIRALGPWQIEIVKRSDLHRFVVLPKAMDRRADVRLDGPQQAAVEGLREHDTLRHRLSALSHDPAYAAPSRSTKPRFVMTNFLNGP